MKVQFEQSGGWGNPLGKACEVDTEELVREDAETLKQLVEQAEITSSVSKLSLVARDAISYHLAIDLGDQTFDVHVDDTTVSETMLPLLEFLQKRAKPRSRR